MKYIIPIITGWVPYFIPNIHLITRVFLVTAHLEESGWDWMENICFWLEFGPGRVEGSTTPPKKKGHLGFQVYVIYMYIFIYDIIIYN